MGYNPEKIIILDKESFIKEKVKDYKRIAKKWGFKPTKEQIENVKKADSAKYDDLMANGYNVGSLVPCVEKIKNIVLYEGEFGFLNNKDVLYYL